MAAASLVLAAACGDQQPAAVQRPTGGRVPQNALQEFDCTASIRTAAVNCAPAAPAGNGSRIVIGGQNTFVKLTSSNVSYNAGTEIFQFDVTVQNLLNEALGTPDGTVPDPEGIRLFFHTGPTVTSGNGTASVANADGVDNFTGADQPYFRYSEILPKDAISGVKTWQLSVPPSANSVSFKVYVETDVQYLLVINEVLVNPGGTITDANGEWVEVYNAGTLKVNMQNLVIADSAASGRRAYHLISSSVPVAPGAYVVLGRTTNTTNNGGVPVDYVYTLTSFPNSLGAFKISRVSGADTLTVDRTQYSSAAISAQNGISRELKNPLLDNGNMDGSNWADASVTAVYGPGGRGTPKAQNSTFTP